jgi:hypothetical protein
VWPYSSWRSFGTRSRTSPLRGTWLRSGSPLAWANKGVLPVCPLMMEQIRTGSSATHRTGWVIAMGLLGSRRCMVCAVLPEGIILAYWEPLPLNCGWPGQTIRGMTRRERQDTATQGKAQWGRHTQPLQWGHAWMVRLTLVYLVPLLVGRRVHAGRGSATLLRSIRGHQPTAPYTSSCTLWTLPHSDRPMAHLVSNLCAVLHLCHAGRP